MVFSKSVAVMLATCVALSGTASLADPKPKGAKASDPDRLAAIYAGKTQTWTSCKGGIYYGPKGQAQAICPSEGKAIGLGTWTVTRKGQVCDTMQWHWKDGDKVGSNEEKTQCIEHLTDAEGTIWRSWPNDPEWWRAEGGKSLTKGFKFKNKITRARKKLKL